jgi:hypothetical protein
MRHHLVVQTRNLPPELQMLFEELDGTLTGMGVQGITKDEAKYLLNTLILSGVGECVHLIDSLTLFHC